MTKTEFLQQLYNHLQPLSPKERDEIIQDFEEHFSAGFENGKTEEQICDELGNPYTCALQYLRQPNNNASQNNTAGNKTNNAYNVNRQPYQSSQSAYGTKNVSGNAQGYNPNVQQQNTSRNRFLWGLLFIFFICCAIGVYPTAIGLMASPVFIIFGAVFAVAAFPSGLMIGLMVSLAIGLFAAGLLMFMIMTWLLKISFRRSGI